MPASQTANVNLFYVHRLFRDKVVLLNLVRHLGIRSRDDVRPLQRPFVSAVHNVPFQPAVTISLI